MQQAHSSERETRKSLWLLDCRAVRGSGIRLAELSYMKANVVTRSFGVALVLPCLAACVGSRSVEQRADPGAQALATGEPAGGESAPIGGRVDLPPQQPRR
jgi:hypothetical protein